MRPEQTNSNAFSLDFELPRFSCIVQWQLTKLTALEGALLFPYSDPGDLLSMVVVVARLPLSCVFLLNQLIPCCQGLPIRRCTSLKSVATETHKHSHFLCPAYACAQVKATKLHSTAVYLTLLSLSRVQVNAAKVIQHNFRRFMARKHGWYGGVSADGTAGGEAGGGANASSKRQPQIQRASSTNVVAQARCGYCCTSMNR